MITLHKLIPPENEALFERNPELNHIWEVPSIQESAKTSYERWGLGCRKSTGKIFSVNLDDKIIGVTGWFTFDETFPDVLRLRYHGIIASMRGRGYGEETMRLLLQHLSHIAPSQYLWLAESVSLSRELAPKIVAHFKKMGFAEFDDANYGDNAGCGKVQSLRVRIPGR